VQPTLLIVEDDAPLRDILRRTLSAEGFEVTVVGSAHQLMEHAVNAPPEALVIDIGLPDADGRDLCQALRARGIDAPVLFLTARDALTDRLGGFSAGGDDYVTKPFDIAELVARLHALIRRARPGPAPARCGLSLDPTRLTVTQDEVTLKLTPTEFRLLAALASSPDQTVARRELTRAAWPHGAIVSDNTLDVYMARLRRKLRALADAPEIGTIHGVGYCLR